MVRSLIKPKVLVLTDWPIYMWIVSSIYLGFTLWAFIMLYYDPK